MADNNFRRYRAHSSEADDAVSQFDRDPLAELARLIGQADPSVGLDRSNSATLLEHVASGSEVFERPSHQGQLDTAYYENTEQYEQPELSYEAEQDQQAYGEPTPVAAYQYPAVPDHEPHYAAYSTVEEELPAVEESHQLPALVPDQPEMAYAADDQWEGQPDDHWQTHSDDQLEVQQDGDYRPAILHRRTLMIAAVAAVGLIVVGSAGAFAYHAMFGSRLLASTPPIIMANTSPNKIVPPSQTASSGQSDSAKGGAEQLVSREEQPVQVQPTNPPPHVVSTLPSAADAFPAAPAPTPQVGSPIFPPVTAAMMPQTPASTPAAPEPKKIHTVAIRSEPAGGSAAHGRTAPNNLARPMAAPGTRASADAPMSLVPAAERSGGTREVARAEGDPATTQSISRGGYTVQITSQRTEAEAKSAYRSLRAKFPQELGSREPIIRRADLGAKGTYFRAMVGPFGSAEAAAEMCGKLKSAGGSCIVQRN